MMARDSRPSKGPAPGVEGRGACEVRGQNAPAISSRDKKKK